MKKNRVVIYEPEVIFWGVAAGFHGYSIAFISQYADYIYIKKESLEKNISYRTQLWRMGIKRIIPFVYSLEKFKECDNIIGFTVPLNDDDELLKFKGRKYFHLMDYYLSVSHNNYFLKKYNIYKVIGHTSMDKNCPFFKEYYPNYCGRVLSLPFGYQSRFECKKSFELRENVAVGLGSINPSDDPLLNYEIKKEFLEYYKQEEYMHPLRRYIQMHEEKFEDVIDSRFPAPEKQKDFSYDAVEVLNDYRMFINDAGLSNFPPARTYEGIACGCVMVAENNRIYEEFGFIPDVNYISFEPGNYDDLIHKIRYYQIHTEELEVIQKKSLELAKKYVHIKVADSLMEMIKRELI